MLIAACLSWKFSACGGLGGGAEPEAALRRQLRLVHAQMLAVLTSLVERTLARRAGFDPQGLLRGAEPVLRMACRRGECDPAAPLEAFTPLPLARSLAPVWRLGHHPSCNGRCSSPRRTSSRPLAPAGPRNSTRTTSSPP